MVELARSVFCCDAVPIWSIVGKTGVGTESKLIG